MEKQIFYDAWISEWGNLLVIKELVSIYKYIVYRRETRGTETSKYSQEEKEKSIPKVVASEIGRAQTKCRNTFGVEDHNKLLEIIAELFWESRPKRVKVS